MAFNGKWKLVGYKNADEICNAFSVPDKKREAFKGFLVANVVDEISCSGTTWSRKSLVNGQKKRDVSVTFGSDCEIPPLVDLSIKVKARYEKVSDTKVTSVETYPQGQVEVAIEVTGDKLIQTATVGPVVFSIEYKRT